MLACAAFVDGLIDHGYNFFTGVPCSLLTPLINHLEEDRRVSYVGATNEGEAVALAAGAWLAGRKCVVMCQNSGLGNAINPLTSLNYPFQIPALLIVTWRGQPDMPDEPQHVLMGAVTPRLLELAEIAHQPFPETKDRITPVLGRVDEMTKIRSLPTALILSKDVLAGNRRTQQPGRPRQRRNSSMNTTIRGSRSTRIAVLERLTNIFPTSAAVISTTGKCSRELFTLRDCSQHFYVIGSMGCASAVGLGVAMNMHRPVVVIDGDGAALMRLEHMASIGARAPENLLHIVLDNGVHDSTGGQITLSSIVDFGAVAAACGYASVSVCNDLNQTEETVLEALRTPGPHFIRVLVHPGSIEHLGRPTLAPVAVAQRFRDFLSSPVAAQTPSRRQQEDIVYG